MKKIIILGSTGSVGLQAMQVARKLRSDLKIVGLAANSNLKVLKLQIKEFRPEIVSLWETRLVPELNCWCRKEKIKVNIVSGMQGLMEIARYESADLAFSSIVGSVGLRPLLEAIKSGKDIALANKEALVVAGDLVMNLARKKKVKIFPVDSEHSAIYQCLKNEKTEKIKRIVLTASGGPFYKRKKALSSISVSEALDHPTWSMGPKITIDSATLMNKGLETIEAHHLFNVPLNKIDIIIHPQSIVHSMVEFVDSSVLAQLSNPDMRLPIQYALMYPERRNSPVKQLCLEDTEKLEFYKPDFVRFPCLKLAIEAGETGGTMPAAMNAANEVAVSFFLKAKIKFNIIPEIIREVMDTHCNCSEPSIEDIFAVDAAARKIAEDIFEKKYKL